MRRKNITNAIIRESITNALLHLMKEKPFQQINVTEIVQEAGVGRVSFYRNFTDKEDVLVTALDESARIWWEEFKSQGRTDYITGLFEHCLSVKDTGIRLYEHGLSHLLLRNIQNLLGPTENDSTKTAYQKSCLVGCVYGVLDEWISRGMVETPEELNDIFANEGIDSLVQNVM